MGIMYTKQEMRQEHHRDKCMNLIDDFYTIYIYGVCRMYHVTFPFEKVRLFELILSVKKNINYFDELF